MRRLEKEEFFNNNIEEIYGIYIEDGEFYFVCWKECSEDYDIVISRNENRVHMKKDMLDDIVSSVTMSDGWSFPMSTENIKAEHNCVNQTILDTMEAKTKAGVNIIELTALEWKYMYHLLKDGYYIMVIVSFFDLEGFTYLNPLRQFHLMDAESQWEEYREINDIKDINLNESDYIILAKRFEDNHDCNIADNIQWQNLIADYARYKRNM